MQYSIHGCPPTQLQSQSNSKEGYNRYTIEAERPIMATARAGVIGSSNGPAQPFASASSQACPYQLMFAATQAKRMANATGKETTVQ